MQTQPNWQYFASIGDKDPIAYGGGFIYIDTTKQYYPEMTYFIPASDDEWHVLGGRSPIKCLRVLLETDSEKEWWWDDLDKIAIYMGRPLEEIRCMALTSVLQEKALLYSSLIQYFGWENFDPNPEILTEEEAYAKYAQYNDNLSSFPNKWPILFDNQ